jgi:tetratricopeptide (TPR) repeat protein
MLASSPRRFPESTGARLGLARINSRAGAIDEAQRLWTEVLRRDPGNNEALSALAGLSLQGGPRGTAARSALEAAVKAAPTSPAAAATLASVFTRTGEPQKALTVLEGEALRSGPLARGAAVHLLRADALAALNRWPDVEAAARTAFADEPDSPVTRRQLAFAMARNGDARGAEELVRAGLRQRPGEALLQQTLVSLVQQSRGLDAALGVADELSRQRDAMPAAAPLRGDLLLSAQRPADAARAYAGAYAAAPSAVLAQRTALAWQAAGDLAQASAALESWLQRSPNDTQVLGLLSQFDLQAGRTQAAEARLSRVVEEAPTDAVALNNLAWVLAQRGGPEALARARSMAERAYFLLPTAEAADTLGWVMVRAGEAEKALPLLREAVAARRAAIPPGGTMAPQDPGMSYRLAVALNEMGDRAEALRVLEPVVAENPTFPERAEAERLLSTLRAGR